MTTLVDLLSQLDRVLDDLGAPVVPHLRGPASAKQVTAMLVAEQIHVHPDVLTWWGWHDGTHLPSATQPPGVMLPELRNQLISGLHMPTLAQAQTARRHALDLDAQVGLVSFWPTWFPLLEFTDGWLVCVQTSDPRNDGSDSARHPGSGAGGAGSVWVWDPHAIDLPGVQRPWMPSVSVLVQSVLDAYRSGVQPSDFGVDFANLPGGARRLGY